MSRKSSNRLVKLVVLTVAAATVAVVVQSSVADIKRYRELREM
jgi:hypothetical protein